MTSLYENYEKVVHTIQKIRKEIAEKRSEASAIASRRNNEIPARIANLEEQLKKIDEYQLKVEGFRQLAEKNLTSKNVLTIEAPPGYRVNLNRLRTWSMMIDPQAADDPYAQRVYLVAKCDAYFLQQKKEEFEARVAELKADLENGSVDELKEIEKSIEECNMRLKEYVNSPEVGEFAEQVKKENNSYIYHTPPERYTQRQEDPAYWMIGASGYDLDAAPECNSQLKALFGTYYDEKYAKVFLPVQILPSAAEFAVTISCVPVRKRLTEMDAGIRALLFNVIDLAKTDSKKVYIIDGERQNSALVGTLRSIEDSAFLNVVPRNTEMITSTLEQIVAGFSDIDDVLENCDTVIEYNAARPEEKKIRRSVIVMVGYPNAFDGKAKDYVKKIMTNYERYGISFITVQITSETDKDKLKTGISEYAGEDVVGIKMTAKDTFIRVGTAEESHFMWYTFRHGLTAEYAAFIRDYKGGNAQKGTEYIKRVDMEHIPPYLRGQKNINVPYGVDGKDEVHSISFENENFAAYLMGASGSGKSTLLHTIITGIIRNYHPDDVELWLADFKMSEFAQYIDPLPPHVKYILLDESQELVYDLIDQLTEKMMERQRFFMRNRDLKKVENVPAKIYMPVIFVILDEFSIMSQVVAENESYKLKLQNLLAKGRALGIKFIFSSQTFTRGIAGLTGTAKEQIQARIAMKNSNDEITSTLELSAANKTDQVKAWMDALPPHYALIKYREGDHTYVKRLKVMYFAGAGAKALEPQQKMIRELNASFRAVSADEYNNGDKTYVDKHPVIVDGNSYKAYDQQKIDAACKEYLKSDSVGFKEDIFISLGDPRRMVSHKFIAVSGESRENILLIGRNAENACMMSVVMSVMKQFQAQGGTVHVWAYVRNRLYHSYKDSQFEGFDVVEGAEEVSVEVGRIKERIDAAETGKDLYVMFGMEQMCSDFEMFAGGVKRTGESRAEKAGAALRHTADLAAKSEEQKKELEKMHEESKELETYLEEKEEELLDSGMDMTELMAELEKLKKEFLAKQAQSAGTDTDAGENAAENVSEEAGGAAENAEDTENVSGSTEDAVSEMPEEAEPEKGPYDASADLKEIVTKGSRYGYHFLMCLSSAADIKLTKTDVRLYNHKLSFQISGDDSLAVFGSKAASKIPEHICQYSNGMEQFSFRPYLHRGIIWDGWDVDEKGQVMDPSGL